MTGTYAPQKNKQSLRSFIYSHTLKSYFTFVAQDWQLFIAVLCGTTVMLKTIKSPE